MKLIILSLFLSTISQAQWAQPLVPSNPNPYVINVVQPPPPPPVTCTQQLLVNGTVQTICN